MDQRTRRWPDRQHTESRHCIAVFVLALLFAVTWNVWGQGSSASIVGTVIDPSGAVVPGFTIVVKNQATGLENSVTTDESGNYLITPLPAGQYSLKGTGSGFKGVTLDNISLAIGDRLRQDMKLEVGAVGESIEVTAQTAALQTDTSSLGSLIEQRAVQDLPVNGRNFVVLAQLAAGANEGESNSLASGARPDDRRQTSAISVNAQPSSYNNFLIDGMDDNERTIGTISVKPSMDALVEMRVQTNLYSAEFGRTAGGLVNFITKSGTNDFHGSLFEFLRNEKMDARNVFAAGAKPSYKQNQFGGSIGGPIRKNSTFFFGDYEGTRLRQGQTYTSLIPTMDQRRGIFTTTVVDPLTRTPFPNNTIPKSAMDQVGYNLVQLYPQPNASNPGYNFVASPMKTQDNDAFDSRADHRLANSDSVFARFSYNKTRTYLPGTLPVDTATGIQAVGDPGTFPGLAKQRAMAAQLNYVHLLGQALVLELRSGFNRYENAALPPNYGTSADDKIGLPGVNLDEASSGLSWVAVSGYRGLGDPNFLPIQETHNTFQNMASVTWMRGAHGLKFGADIRRRQIVLYQSNQPKGSFSFDGNLAGEPVASLLMGYPASTTVSRLLVWPGWRLWESAAYFQDDWRVNRWLTLNLGVRWDYLGPITEVANRISNVDPWSGRILIAGQNGVSASAGVPANFKDFSPRFGFAATLAKGTVLRGGYGINYVPQYLGGQYNNRNPPFVSLYTAAATATVPVNRLTGGLPAIVPTDPLNPKGNLSAVPLDAATPYVQQYNVTLQRELPKGFVLTVGYASALGRRQYKFNASSNINQPAPANTTASIQSRRPFVNLFPNVGNINMYAPWYNTNYHGLQSTIERRLSNGLSVLGTFTWAHSIDDYTGQDPYNRAAERANSYLDQRKRFTFLTNYSVPFGKNGSGIAAMLAKDWSVSAIVVLATGLPFNITDASAQSQTGGTDRPNIVGDPLANFDQSPSMWFNRAVFRYQPIGTYGNAGRNLLHAPGRANLDFSLHREFAVRDKTRLQFRAEAFNITNTPPFNAPNSTYSPTSTNFGVITGAGLPRNIQVALKLLF